MSRFTDFITEANKADQKAQQAQKNVNVRKQVFDILKANNGRDKKGLLIVFEGTDGSGKTTQSKLLEEWLKDQNYDVEMTKWNSSKIMKDAIGKAKDDRMMSPMLYCLMHASDMVIRYEKDVSPWLEDNRIVIGDRYIYTSIVRDKARGVNVEILNEIYKGWREPDILFHCSVPIHKAFARLVKEKSLSYYGTGMDLNLADNKEDNYLKYGHILDKYYKKILPEVKSYHYLNMDRPIEEIHEEVKDAIKEITGIGKYSKD